MHSDAILTLVIAAFSALCVLIWLIISKVFISIIAKKVEERILHNPRHLLRPRVSTYLTELTKMLEAMPFIYKDLRSDVLNDFVDITHQSMDLESLIPKRPYIPPKIEHAEVDLKDRLRDSRRVLFLGSAGIGKSTYQRRAALKIIGRKADFIHSREDPIPFFIQLKVVNNSVPNPILNYIIERAPWLSGEKGLRKLIRLANDQQLFFFLDGYDEIQFDGSTGTNFVREELNKMMRSAPRTPRQIPRSPTVDDFYDSLGNCRIWLTSRKEFFAQHRVKMSPSDRSVGVFVLELKGIGDNRLKLVQNIFNRYRKVTGTEDLFSEQFFLQKIDAAPDTELHDMSENPLWLTVMCYTYAHKVMDRREYRIATASNFYELVSECLSLLLEDLDEFKVRALDKPDQVALSLDRNRYIPEKKDFLAYFAAQLFCGEARIKTVFDLTFIEGKAKDYFENDSISVNREEILNSLANRAQSNFALQLINSGIFVIVDKIGDDEVFDFPHRRFREVLASEYFSRYGFGFLVDNLKKEGLSELLYVFFNRSRSQDAILDALFTALAQSPDDNYYGALINDCLKKAPPNYDPSRSLRRFFENCIRNNIEFRLPVAVLSEFQFDENITDVCSRGFKQALIEERDAALFLCASLLARFNKPLLQELSSTLIPLLDQHRALAMRAAIAFPELYKGVNASTDKSEFVELFLHLKSNFLNIEKANRRIPYSSDENIACCYLVTGEVISATQDHLRQMGLPADDTVRENLETHRLRVYFTSDFLAKSKPELDPIVERIVIRLSSIEYEGYCEIMKTIEHFEARKPGTLRFFVGRDQDKLNDN